jgi:hypothetical protein
VDDLVRLGPDEEPPDHPVARLERTRADLAAIREMAAALRRLLRASLPPAPRPVVLDAAAPGGRLHRVVLCDEGRLRQLGSPDLVGFFGERRLGLDHMPLTTTDDLLIAELPAHPGILSYSSLQLADENWGNLIVLEAPEARDRWRESPRHAWAVEELAPRHYAAVRLHRGHVPGGLVGGGEPRLTLTRYFDYRDPRPWRAERTLDPEP